MHITGCTIENFKRFGHLEVDNIDQFNLVVGDNNVGKTTLLEALLINENPNDSYVRLYDAIAYRSVQIDFQNTRKVISILLSKREADKALCLRLRGDNKTNIDIQLNSIQLENLTQKELFELQNEIIINQGQTNLIKYVKNGITTYIFPKLVKHYVPMLFVNLGYQADLVEFYTTVIQKTSSLKKAFIANLQLFEDSIIDVEISTEFYQSGFLIVRTRNIDEAMPITMFGEGVVKLTRILLEIMMCKGDRLMIDEIDTGIHHSRFKKYWKTILKSALMNEVQIFATTHSKECLQYFKEVLGEEEMKSFKELSRCIRLVAQKDNEVKAVTYDFEQFQFALDHENEVR